MTTPAPNLVVHPSAMEPGEGIWFVTPTGFVSLPLKVLVSSPNSVDGDRLREALNPILLSAPDEASRQQFIAGLATAQRMLHSVYSAGTVHCAMGLHCDDSDGGDGSTLLSLFTISWVDSAWAPRGVTAARAIVTAEGHTHVEYTEVPCGPAAFSEKVRVPSAESGFPQQPLLQIHAHLPYPDGTSLALLTLSTTAVARREEYRTILRMMAETVSFEDPFAPGTGDVSVGGDEKRR